MFKFLAPTLIACLLVIPKGNAGDVFVPEILPGSQIVELGGKDGKEKQTHKKLRIAPSPELNTTILYTQNGLVFPTEKAVIIALAGTGGSAGVYGVASSMTKLANSMLKNNINTIALENPLYWNFRDHPADREHTIEYYRHVVNQMDWLYKSVSFIADKIDKLHGPNNNIPILVVGRSTGSALWQEAMHRYLLGDPRARIIGRIKFINVWGINGHTSEDIFRWSRLERVTFNEHARSEDPLVSKASQVLFDEMTWQTGEMPEDLKGSLLGRPAPDSGPSVVSIVSMKDEYTPQADQLRIQNQFGESHPGVKLRVYQFPTKHDPSAGFSERDEAGIIILKKEPMEMVQPILLDQAFGRLQVESGIQILPVNSYSPSLVQCTTDLTSLPQTSQL